jgi:hypothetical protein
MLYVDETAEPAGTGTSKITKLNLTTIMISVTVVCVRDKTVLNFIKVWPPRCACRIRTYLLHVAESLRSQQVLS